MNIEPFDTEMQQRNLTAWMVRSFLNGDNDGLREAVRRKVELANRQQRESIRVGVWLDAEEHASLVWYADASLGACQAKRDAVENLSQVHWLRLRGVRQLSADEHVGMTQPLEAR